MFAALGQLDYQLVEGATDWASQAPWHYDIVYFCAVFLLVLYPLMLWYLWLKPEKRGTEHGTQKAVMLALLCIVLVIAAKSVIGFFWFRERPFITYPDLYTLNLRVDPGSFPSEHAMISFTVAWSLFLSGFRRLGAWLMLAAVFVSLGRVFAGVHYPSDVLFGALFGILVAWYMHRESNTLKRYLPDY